MRGEYAWWVRPALIALLVITAFAYFWDLSASGYANSFYAAAVQAGTKSWKAFFFGSIDSSNFITVDKPPASLWVMELSGRIFGFSSWSTLDPEALAGVASVGILYATVKRWFGAAGRPAGRRGVGVDTGGGADVPLQQPRRAARAASRRERLHPHPCAEKAGTRWLVATGALLGFAFLTKMMQAFTVVPASYIVYLLAAPTSLARRIKQLVACTGALAVAAGWWVITVASVAGRVAADDRRLARQQYLEPDLRLQRIRPAREQRCGRKWKRIQRSDRRLPAVQRPYGWPSIMAVARRAARAP